jgi:hypothetical protein
VVGSVKKFQLDDYIMMFAMVINPQSLLLTAPPADTTQVTDTVLIASMNIIAVTSSNLIDPSQNVILTPESIKERVFGSKMVLVVEQMQILTIWAVKACLLLLYNRLTFVNFLSNTLSYARLTPLQYEFAPEHRRQGRRRIRRRQLRRHGDPLPRRLVQALYPVLGRPARQRYV